jgi:hypothetical protein
LRSFGHSSSQASTSLIATGNWAAPKEPLPISAHG